MIVSRSFSVCSVPSAVITVFLCALGVLGGEIRPPRRSAILRVMRTTDVHPFAAVPVGTTVSIRAHKYDGAEYRRWTIEFAAAFAGGVRLETVFSPVVEGRTPFFGGDRAVECFYTDRGYNIIAGFAPDGTPRGCYCNICQPARLVSGVDGPEIHFVDLDLDVLVAPAGACTVTDEDEFARNAVRYAYPAAVRRAARRAVTRLLSAVRERQAPFDELLRPVQP
jgi:protein associated with RNAse G/E